MTDSIFGGDDNPNGNTAVAPVLPDHLKDLVGEGKKYATLEKALESIPHAQSHIATLEAELADLRKKVESAAPQEDVLKTVQEYLEAERKKTNATGVPDIASVVKEVLGRELTALEQQKTAEGNKAVVNAAMKEKFGDKAKEVFETKAKELGVGPKFLEELIAKSAEAGMELLGLKKKESTPNPTRGTINTAALSQREQQQPDRKKIMTGGAKTSDVVAEWRRHDPTKKE